MDFDNFCSFFECHSIFAEKQRTKQTNYSSLSLSASLDTQDTLQGGIIVEWKKFRQEIPVCSQDPLIKFLQYLYPCLCSDVRGYAYVYITKFRPSTVF